MGKRKASGSAAHDLQALFPKLKRGRFRVTSPATREYNCIAWAARESSRWEAAPMALCYWPLKVNPFRASSLEAVLQMFTEHLAFELCDSGEHEDGFERIAIYSAGPQFLHVARQLSNGQWTSKLGRREDIEHDSVEDLCGYPPAYGEVTHFLKRRTNVSR
jgi:hypothetical protein